MGKESPDYWPEELPLGGMKKTEYAESIGLKPKRLYSFFGGNHKNLMPYCRLSDKTGASLDHIYTALATGKFEEFINKHKKTLSLRRFAEEVGVSSTFLSDRCSGKVGTNGIQEYQDMAVKNNCNLETMRTYCRIPKPLVN